MTRPLATILAEARSQSGHYADAAAKALETALKQDAQVAKLVGFAFLGGQPHVRCTATLDFDFAEKAVRVHVQAVAVGHAIVEKIA